MSIKKFMVLAILLTPCVGINAANAANLKFNDNTSANTKNGFYYIYDLNEKSNVTGVYDEYGGKQTKYKNSGLVQTCNGQNLRYYNDWEKYASAVVIDYDCTIYYHCNNQESGQGDSAFFNGADCWPSCEGMTTKDKSGSSSSSSGGDATGTSTPSANQESPLVRAAEIVDNFSNGFGKANQWVNADGGFNTARLVSDSVAGVLLGSAGGVITGVVVKKNQVKKGFEDISCSVGGQILGNYGDDIRISNQ